jgi:hypothetical protein
LFFPVSLNPTLGLLAPFAPNAFANFDVFLALFLFFTFDLEGAHKVIIALAFHFAATHE